MGLKSEGSAGCTVWGIGVMKALFHWCDTTPLWWMDWLKSWANGAEKAGAPRRRNYDEIKSGPVVV